ncbi:MAG TPA: ribulokinase, partial [Saprospiraceae bacterium]|nr:ribulokinase [Saprospiraceae bacterium]
MDKYTIGIDFGTDSVRAIVVNTTNGQNIASAVSYYKRWKSQMYCNPTKSSFRQHPLDYIESLHDVLHEVCETVGKEVRSYIVGISVDTTGSTPV